MYLKIINPIKQGLPIYNNKASCGKLIDYLNEQNQNLDEKNHFFNDKLDSISAESAMRNIDKNSCTLKSTQDKFISLVISPSDVELKLINNSNEHLMNYTKDVVKAYAENFNDTKFPEVNSENLEWYAIIHEFRHYKHNEIYYSKSELKDKNLQEGAKREGMENFNVGDKKDGSNKHIHVIISTKLIDSKHYINPLNRKQKTFSIHNFKTQSIIDFANKYNSISSIRDFKYGINKQYLNLILKKLMTLNKKYGLRLDPDKFSKLLANFDNNKNVYDALLKLESHYAANFKEQSIEKIVNPYELIITSAKEFEAHDPLKDTRVKKDIIKDPSINISLPITSHLKKALMQDPEEEQEVNISEQQKRGRKR